MSTSKLPEQEGFEIGVDYGGPLRAASPKAGAVVPSRPRSNLIASQTPAA